MFCGWFSKHELLKHHNGVHNVLVKEVSMETCHVQTVACLHLKTNAIITIA